jgi:putative FmdB family regulatory protein
MPTYEYSCEKCKKDFEIFQSMKDDAFKTCPKEACRMKTWGKGKVKRQLGSGAGLIFKGSGFYITDYRSENYKSAAKSDSASKESSSSGSSSSGSSSGSSAAPSPSGSKSSGGSSGGSKGGESKPASKPKKAD